MFTAVRAFDTWPFKSRILFYCLLIFNGVNFKRAPCGHDYGASPPLGECSADVSSATFPILSRDPDLSRTPREN